LKFGPMAAEVQERIRATTPAELDRMGERLLDASTLDALLGSS